MITPEQYRQSVKDGRVVFCGGERVEDVAQHPSLRVNFLMCAMDYVLAQDLRYQGLFTERNEEGELVHFVFIPRKSPQNLLRRREIIQIAARTCFGLPAAAKFTGVDGLNALAVVCRRLDRYTGMNYTERVEAYRKYVQKHDPAMGLAMTDVKGGRSLRPSRQQTHKDYYTQDR